MKNVVFFFVMVLAIAGHGQDPTSTFNYFVNTEAEVDYEVMPDSLEVGVAAGTAGGLLVSAESFVETSNTMEEIFTASDTYDQLFDVYKTNAVVDFLSLSNVVVTDNLSQNLPRKAMQFLSMGQDLTAEGSGYMFSPVVTDEKEGEEGDAISVPLDWLIDLVPVGIKVGIPMTIDLHVPVVMTRAIKMFSIITCCFVVLGSAYHSFKIAFSF